MSFSAASNGWNGVASLGVSLGEASHGRHREQAQSEKASVGSTR